MGNASSSSIEATPPPRKTPHKLSKPRVGNHASTTAGLLSSNGRLASSITRVPNFSLDDGDQPRTTRPSSFFFSRPPSRAVQASSSVAIPISTPLSAQPPIEPIVTSPATHERVEQPLEPPPKETSNRRRSFLRSRSSRRWSGEQWQASPGFTIPRKDDGLPRVQSMIYDSRQTQNFSRHITGRFVQ